MWEADTTTTTDGGRSGKRSQRLLWPRFVSLMVGGGARPLPDGVRPLREAAVAALRPCDRGGQNEATATSIGDKEGMECGR